VTSRGVEKLLVLAPSRGSGRKRGAASEDSAYIGRMVPPVGRISNARPSLRFLVVTVGGLYATGLATAWLAVSMFGTLPSTAALAGGLAIVACGLAFAVSLMVLGVRTYWRLIHWPVVRWLLLGPSVFAIYVVVFVLIAMMASVAGFPVADI
jgi:hypothetical protein